MLFTRLLIMPHETGPDDNIPLPAVRFERGPLPLEAHFQRAQTCHRHRYDGIQIKQTIHSLPSEPQLCQRGEVAERRRECGATGIVEAVDFEVEPC